MRRCGTLYCQVFVQLPSVVQLAAVMMSWIDSITMGQDQAEWHAHEIAQGIS